MQIHDNGYTRYETADQAGGPYNPGYDRYGSRDDGRNVGNAPSDLQWDGYGGRGERGEEVYNGGHVYQSTPYVNPYGGPSQHPAQIHSGYGEPGYFSAAAASAAPLPFTQTPTRVPTGEFVDDRPDRNAPRTIYNHSSGAPLQPPGSNLYGPPQASPGMPYGHPHYAITGNGPPAYGRAYQPYPNLGVAMGNQDVHPQHEGPPQPMHQNHPHTHHQQQHHESSSGIHEGDNGYHPR